MSMKMIEYIGRPVSELLKTKPFSDWTFERTVEDEEEFYTEIHYQTKGYGLSIICDKDDIVDTIFLKSNHYAEAGNEFQIVPFFSKRTEVLQSFEVKPEKSGEGYVDDILGEYGGYDRFRLSKGLVHIEYQPKKDIIKMITLMRLDAFQSV